MAKQCKSFTYMDRSMEDFHLVTVNLDDSDEVPLALKRTILKGGTSRYRLKANHIGVTFDEPLTFEMHFIKDAISGTQEDYRFSREEIRDVLKWLTAPSRPSLLRVTDKAPLSGALNYCGLFTDIQAFTVDGQIFGLIATFTNDSPFSYTDELDDIIPVNGHTSTVLSNNSDLTDGCCYPTLLIEPGERSDFFLLNLSDCRILFEGSLSLSGGRDTDLEKLLEQVEAFALRNTYAVTYYYDEQYKYKTLADDTALRVKYTEKDKTEHHCLAFFKTDGTFQIIEGGFLILKLQKDLPITVNCRLLTMTDSLGRMILFRDIGLADEDYIYWPRLQYGDNSILFFAADCQVTVTRRELIKAGAY